MPAAEPPPSLFPDDEIKELFAVVARERHVAVAVSGGSDSIALMHLAHRWVHLSHRHPGGATFPLPLAGRGRGGGLAALPSLTRQRAKLLAIPDPHPYPSPSPQGGGETDRSSSANCPKLTILTVDHMLRPESAAEAQAVGARANDLGLDHAVLPWEGAKPATGLQAAARAARYRLMGGWCRSHGVSVLMVAHTVDDQAETVLMRLKRGAGVEGLGGMAATTQHDGLTVFRPLLGVPRRRLRDYLEAIGQRWFDDPSNDNEAFERVRMRNVLAGAGLEAASIALTASRARRAFDAILRVTRTFLDAQVKHHGEGFGEISLPGLLAEPQEIRIRALWSLVTRYGDHGFAELSQVEDLSQWVDAGEGQARTLGGCRIARRSASLVFGREPGRISPDPVPVPDSGRLRWDNRFDISVAGRPSGIAIIPAGHAGKVERRPDLPAFVQAGLPAVLVEGRLAAIPGLGLRTPTAPPDLAVTATFGARPWF